MARIKFGAMMVDARGKLGGHVFSKNRGGAYLRTKVTPSNPQTPDQVAQRATLANASSNWKSLTETQRLAWNEAVTQYSTTNIFGDIVNPSGSVLHTRLNINVALAGGSALTAPPLPMGVDTVQGVSAVATAGTPNVTLSWTSGAVPTGHVMVVEATTQMSPGIFNASNKFRVIGTLPAATATGEDITAIYNAKFGTLVAGQKLFVRAKLIRIATGEVSVAVSSSVIVAA